QHKLSLVLEMPMSQIRVIKPLVGGGFGGKSEVIPLEIIAAVAARAAKRPVTILYSGALLGAIYDIPNVGYDGYRVLTNKPACGAMRGHGTVNVRFAFESQLDEICAQLKLDPLAVRQKNFLKPPCITVNGLRVQSYGLPECIQKVADGSGWKKRRGKLGRGRGLGMGCSHYVSG